MVAPELMRALFEAARSGKRAATENLAAALEANRLDMMASGEMPKPEVTTYGASATRPAGYPADVPFIPHHDVKLLHSHGAPDPYVRWSGSTDAAASVDMIVAQSIEAGWERRRRFAKSDINLDPLVYHGRCRLIVWGGNANGIQMLHLPTSPYKD